MAITYKLFLDQRRTKETGIYPLKVRITYNRKHKEVPLNITLHTSNWNAATQKIKSSHPNAKLINVKINQTLNEIQEKALKFETTERLYNVEDLANNGTISKTTFLSFASNEIDNMIKTGRVGNANAYRDATNKLIKYTGKNGLKFENIDYKLLENFTQSMLADGMKVNAVAV